MSLKSSVGYALFFLGRWREARPKLEECERALAKAGQWVEWSRLVGYLGMGSPLAGDITRGLAFLKSSMARAQKLNYSTYLSFQHVYAAGIWLFAENWSAMADEARECARIALLANDFGMAMTGKAMEEWAAIRLGDRASADRLRHDIQGLRDRVDGTTVDEWLRVLEIERPLELGAPEEAAAAGERVVLGAKAAGNLIADTVGNRSWARALSALKRFGEAENRLMEA